MEIPSFILLKDFYNLTFLPIKKGWINPKKTVDKRVHNLWKGGKVKKIKLYILNNYKK